ncbi:DNA glycosylase AlkZ-like family protein [Streptomyces sp. G5(2025)]|uniref:DNA glycosylase AlkZ-like family protein n=1 Tax=Streptomyces sp. G5(2025) TaxID=3406628 RepID=UPI003C186A87
MRRTMFAVPADLAPVLHAASVTDTHNQRSSAFKRLAEAVGWDEARYLAAEADLLAALAALGQATAAELAAALPALAEQIVTFPGKPYASRRRICTTVLGVLAAEGRVRRARPACRFLDLRPVPLDRRHPLPELPADEARTDVARRCLAAFGPATADDLKWWTGWTVTHTRKAIAATGAEAVELDEGTGYLLPEDAPPPTPDEPRAALLPGLEPTSMGRRHRAWYLDDAHTGALFDRNGDIGPTIWWDGRVIGAWAQRSAGPISHRLLTDPGSRARAAVDGEISRLRAFLGTTRVTPCYRTPVERRLVA